MSDGQQKPDRTESADTVPAPETQKLEADAAPPATSTASTADAAADTSADTPAAENETSARDEPTPIAQLWSLAQSAGHPEIWGVMLADPEKHVPTQIVLQKYLNANDGDLAKAKDQLTKTLEWRARTKPLDLVKKVFSKTKFDGLGYVTKYSQDGSTEPEAKEVFTWNIYGGVKSIDETFGKLDE